MKAYDRAYFDRWYRGDDPPLDPGALGRSVALAVAAAEAVLGREVESVLDMGCGEGRWQPLIREVRPDASYLGIDPSAYAVERFGEERNLRVGSFRELPGMELPEPYDLVVCADVLHYLGKEEVLVGMEALADLTGGVAFLETFAQEDPAELGDREGFHPRPALWYRRVFEAAGLVPLGLHLWTHRELAAELDSLELPHPIAPAPDP